MNWFYFRAVTDPRSGKRVALKKMPNVFQNIVSSKRVFRELRMLCFFKHENVSSYLAIFLAMKTIDINFYNGFSS